LGLVDFFGEPKIRALSDAWWHAGANVLAVLLELYNFYIRYTGRESDDGSGDLADRRLHPPVQRMERMGHGLQAPCRRVGCASTVSQKSCIPMAIGFRI
jgi:hypothetical protein